MIKPSFLTLFLFLFFFLTTSTLAQEEENLPRFESLKADKVYARTGPGLRYPIKWVYERRGLPVEITRTYDQWRQIRDPDGEEGWVHRTLLTGRRGGVILADQPVELRRKPEVAARMTARFEPGVVVRIEECAASWCHAAAGGFKGWIERKYIWGIYEGEIFN